MTTTRLWRLAAPLALSCSVGGCEQVIGLNALHDVYCVGGVDTQPCYTGPAGTEGKGKCRGGTQTCLPDGSGFGECIGQVLPDASDDCSGRLCKAGETKPCYGGPPGTEGLGACVSGTQVCALDGMSFGPCEGEVTPDPTNPNGGACDATQWAVTYGNASNESVIDLGVDDAGNVFVLGSFSGTLTLGDIKLIAAGGTNLFLAKLDPAGRVLWAKRFGNATLNSISARMVVDSSGPILAGAFLGTQDFGAGNVTSAGDLDAFVVKLDGSGAHQWSKTFGDVAIQQAAAVAVDSKGDVILGGTMAGTTSFGGAAFTSVGLADAFLVKLAGKDGAHLWSKAMPVEAQKWAYITVLGTDSSDNIIAGGGQSGPANFGTQSKGTEGFVLVRYDASGNAAWEWRFPEQLTGPRISAVVPDSAGNPTIFGTYSYTINLGGSDLTSFCDSVCSLEQLALFGAKYDGAGGTHLWSKSFAPVMGTAPAAILGEMDEVIVGGSFGLSIDLGGGEVMTNVMRSAFLGKLSPSGTQLGLETFGDAGSSAIVAVGRDRNTKSIVVAGTTDGSLTFGQHVLTAKGGVDIFVAKLAPGTL